MRVLKIAGKILAVALLLAVLMGGPACYLQYRRCNLETLPMDDAARALVPGSFVNLPNGATHYELAGPAGARTVVLVHGFSVPYYIWDPTFDALVKAGFRVLRYDLFGRGWSDRPDVAYDPDFFDAQLTQLLAALGISGPVDVAGISMGGPIVTTFANRHPERVRSVVLFDPAYDAGFAPPLELRVPVLNEFVFCVKFMPNLPASQREDFVHPERYPEYFARYETQMRYKGFRHAMLSTVRDYLSRNNTGEYARLGRSGKPVLLFWGKADQDVPYALSDKVRKDVPQAEFHAIDDAAHVPFMEHPEVVHPILIEFLRRR
ncbi:MAG TPA: alpha/beta hydrolase [Methylomirabilota bacterium]|nr:alpha/beta hydrolase [Methylomirabilota bacterium]